MALTESFLASALEAAHRAADLAEVGIRARYAARDFSVDAKADATPVTEADREAELAIKDVLRAAFPDHAFLGEEHGREGDSDYLWLIDPIDGTKAFVRGYPMFSTQIALMYRGDLVLGVSAAGEYGERAWAVRGGGAYIGTSAATGKRVHVSETNGFGPMAAISTGNLKSMARDPRRWQVLGELVSRVGRIRGYGDFLHYHLLAQGSIDLVVESDLNILDIAALVVIVREAGGVFTTLDGDPVGLDVRNALAGAPAVHAEALALFKP